MTRVDYAFIPHMIEAMRLKTGRMTVVAPHDILLGGSLEGAIPRKLIKGNLLAVVPPHAGPRRPRRAAGGCRKSLPPGQ
ncbi:N-6 DNA methylase [Mesorhizobium sp. J18]|uniref:N-6 DNA methylase n=1 Tax=Mesorhizobium sp. J18 TaxID=935263 RepID=UPI0016492BFB|nr:N-6 DNA methylase [Mesorhizobium sp. J18]